MIDVEEEATFFTECVNSHLAESHPYEPITTYEVEYDIRSLRECKLVRYKVMSLLNTLRNNQEEGKLP